MKTHNFEFSYWQLHCKREKDFWCLKLFLQIYCPQKCTIVLHHDPWSWVLWQVSRPGTSLHLLIFTVLNLYSVKTTSHRTMSFPGVYLLFYTRLTRLPTECRQNVHLTFPWNVRKEPNTYHYALNKRTKKKKRIKPKQNSQTIVKSERQNPYFYDCLVSCQAQ